MTPKEASNGLLEICKQLESLAKSIARLEAKTPVFPEEKQRLVDGRVCLRCGLKIEDHETPDRGCHRKCAKAIRVQIDSGEFTDDDAIRSGLLLPPKAGGRKKSEKNLETLKQVREALGQQAGKAKAPKKPRA